jgi:SagB-type dehydrogenase family enzyme
MSLEAALGGRKSVRDFATQAVTLRQVSQLLWAAQGVTHGDQLRTAPSAGALYPLELYLVADRVEGLARGVGHYRPVRHELVGMRDGDFLPGLSAAALGQECVGDAAAVIVVAAVYERTTKKYGERGVRYVHVEVGLAAENICLQAVSLGLSTVMVGAFSDTQVRRLLDMPADHRPLLLLPLGMEK